MRGWKGVVVAGRQAGAHWSRCVAPPLACEAPCPIDLLQGFVVSRRLASQLGRRGSAGRTRRPEAAAGVAASQPLDVGQLSAVRARLTVVDGGLVPR